MKFGIYVPPFGEYADARVLAGLARDAEEAGWDGFFTWDHVWNMQGPWSFEAMRERILQGIWDRCLRCGAPQASIPIQKCAY